jgi:hypothetical protein
MKPAFHATLLVAAAVLAGCPTASVPPLGTPTAWPVPTVTPCAPPTQLSHGHRLHHATFACVGPWRATRRPHVSLTFPLGPGAEPPGLVGSAALLVTIAADAPDPVRPENRPSFRTTALHDGLELVPIARPDRVGWLVHLPANPNPRDAARAIELLVRLARTPTFGAALVATTAERFSAANAPSDPNHTTALLSAWALALADGYDTPRGGPPDARTLAVVNREDLARLHRAVFTDTTADLVIADTPFDPTAIDRALDPLTSNVHAAPTPPCRPDAVPPHVAIRTPHDTSVINAEIDTQLAWQLADLVELLQLDGSGALITTNPNNGQKRLIASDDAMNALIDLARSETTALAQRHQQPTPTLVESLVALRSAPTTISVHGYSDTPPPGSTLITELRCQPRR